MALAFVHRLYEHISVLEELGMLNSNFASAYELKPASGSRYFLDLVLGFCNDMEAGLRELALALYFSTTILVRELPVVDYEYMFEHCMKIRRSAIRIGACALALAVEDLRNAIDISSKDRCNLAVRRMQQECQLLYLPLNTIIELERRIIHLSGNQAGPGNN